MRRALAALALTFAAGGAAQPTAPLKLWRLDCGTIEVADFGLFSDTGAFRGQPRRMASSCYLIRHGDRLMLWDTGVVADAKARPQKVGPFTTTLTATLPEQLARIGVRPEEVELIGLSHYHGDHTGQARAFPQATLLIGRADMEVVRAGEAMALARTALAPWVAGGGKLDLVNGDRDVFGDGRVTMVDLPGHTPGHHALLVRLRSRTVLLGGDQFHSAPSMAAQTVPQFNTDRAATLASHDRFLKLAKSWRATVVLQHEAADIAKLPPFPAVAE